MPSSDAAPTPAQADWMRLGYGMFVHFGPVDLLRQRRRQVSRRARGRAGARHARLGAAGRRSGHALRRAHRQARRRLLPVAERAHARTRSRPRRRGAIWVGEFVAAFAAEGLKVGLYYALLDRHCPFFEDDARYAAYVRDQVERAARPATATSSSCGSTARGTRIIRRATGRTIRRGTPATGARWEWARLYEHIHRLQPRCLVIQNSSSDRPGVPNYLPVDARTSEHFDFVWQERLCAPRLDPVFPSAHGSVYLPLEYCTTLTPGWFWQAGALLLARLGGDHRRLAAARRGAAREPAAQRRARHFGAHPGLSPAVPARGRAARARRAAVTMRPTVIVVSHTHWDREWYQPFEIFRAAAVRHGGGAARHPRRRSRGSATSCSTGRPCASTTSSSCARRCARAAARRTSPPGASASGPWYVLQDEFLVGAESIVRNLSEGLRSARRFGRADGHRLSARRVRPYRADAAHPARLRHRRPRSCGAASATPAPGSEWRWRAPGGAEVLCLFLPGRLRQRAPRSAPMTTPRWRDCAPIWRTSCRSAARRLLLWMNGNDHQPAEPRGAGARWPRSGARCPTSTSSTPRSSAPRRAGARARRRGGAAGRRRRAAPRHADGAGALGRLVGAQLAEARPRSGARRCWCASPSRSSRWRRSIVARRWPTPGACSCSASRTTRSAAARSTRCIATSTTRLRRVTQLGAHAA